MQAELKQAVDAKLTKEGEVSVLRKAMEKVRRTAVISFRVALVSH